MHTNVSVDEHLHKFARENKISISGILRKALEEEYEKANQHPGRQTHGADSSTDHLNLKEGSV
ncbi:type II toxin-antitoxin system CcdA family antitoxin [Methanoplanus endosymbiosus]|uniref:Type II toxin-antitoxin system CcdA family antitoxin n=1 Tax=Methanoplanus endosymbiosus TaxID=33865 RepID=A0A9E7PPS7_9EURY|nr:type II toxin-antitoxin system CcdA family antitoxin [Methanoplanus endosymbiosus]UUX93227.1 type II toxin-antitoxin system CcdA family antitoxin [Methanoplanus endosymbiosus]